MTLYDSPIQPYEKENFSELMCCLKLPLTGALVRRIFMLLLRAHYSSGSNYPQEYEHLKCMVWDPDPIKSTLTVDVLNKFVDTAPDAFPGIYTGVTSNQSSTTVIGGYAGANDDGSRQIVASECVVGVRIAHVSRNEADALDMADMSMTFLKAMAPFIADDMQASAIRINGYAAANKKPTQSDRFYAVDLSASVTYNHRVATILQGHRIAAIQISVNTTE